MSLRPPKSVKVGTSKFPIHVVAEYPRDCDDNSYGLTNLPTETIYIKADQAEGQMKDTVAHEVLHAIANRGAFRISDENEERMIQQIVPWLLLVIQDNPKLVAYLQEKVK